MCPCIRSFTDLFVSSFFLQKRLSVVTMRSLLQSSIICVTFLADLQRFPLKLILYPHLQVYRFSAFNASASKSVLMDIRCARKI